MALPLFSLLALCSLFPALLYKTLIYPLFLDPLLSIPAAHWSVPFSPLWILWVRFRARANATTYAAHVKYGPIVRLAPSELSINCVDGGLRTVYSGGFEKHDWYPRLFPSYGVMNMFSSAHHGPHSAKKRLLSNIYSKSYLQTSTQLAANSYTLLTTRFLPFMHAAAEAGTLIDVHDMNNAFTMDFMSAYQFGLASSTNFTHDLAIRRKFLHAYHCRKDYEFYSQEVPFLKRLTASLGFPLVPRVVDQANDLLESHGLRMCDKADSYTSPSSPPPAYPGDEPIVYAHFKTGLAKSRVKGTHPADSSALRLEVASEMLDHLGAGHETSAIALTYLYYELALHPSIQSRLRAELLTLTPPLIFPSPPDTLFTLPPPKSLDTLPLLHACITETLRLHSPIPGAEPRITPPSGTFLANHPTRIPGGIRVAALPYALHRNASVFPDPERWHPDRWMIPAESDEMKDMMRWFWAFGSGGRMCIGSHLAMQEMKLLVACIIGNWAVEVMDATGIEPVDAYTTKPRANQLIVRWLRT